MVKGILLLKKVLNDFFDFAAAHNILLIEMLK